MGVLRTRSVWGLARAGKTFLLGQPNIQRVNESTRGVRSGASFTKTGPTLADIPAKNWDYSAGTLLWPVTEPDTWIFVDYDWDDTSADTSSQISAQKSQEVQDLRDIQAGIITGSAATIKLAEILETAI